jgi:hypothetical protein
LIIIRWTHSRKPFKLLDTLLAKNGEVISSLLTGRHNKNLFVFIIPQGPQHKGSRDPGLTKTPKRLDL